MSPLLQAAGRRRAARVLFALAAATACLGAALALAATRPAGGEEPQALGENRVVKGVGGSSPGPGGGVGPKRHRERLLRPQFLEAPPPSTEDANPTFRFHVPPRKAPDASPADGPDAPSLQGSTRRFQCRIDGDGWQDCKSPYRLSGLSPGEHRFAVRVFNRDGRLGETTETSWVQTSPPEPDIAVGPATGTETVEAKEFSIEALAEPEGLFPGFPPTPIPLRITNPNPVPIEVTALRVAIGDAPEGCGAANFELVPGAVSPSEPLQIPAGGSAELPTETIAAPSVRMLNLPVNQDACQEAQIPLIFSGEARG